MKRRTVPSATSRKDFQKRKGDRYNRRYLKMKYKEEKGIRLDYNRRLVGVGRKFLEEVGRVEL